MLMRAGAATELMGPLDFASMANTKWYMNLVTEVEPGRGPD